MEGVGKRASSSGAVFKDWETLPDGYRVLKLSISVLLCLFVFVLLILFGIKSQVLQDTGPDRKEDDLGI